MKVFVILGAVPAWLSDAEVRRVVEHWAAAS